MTCKDCEPGRKVHREVIKKTNEEYTKEKRQAAAKKREREMTLEQRSERAKKGWMKRRAS